MKSKQFSWRRLILAILFAGVALTLFALAVRTPVAKSQGRQVEYNIPKKVPIKLKLKAEKEAKFKDMSNSEWLREFELEVTNVSEKPIYFLELWLTLPDIKSENNNPISFSLRFGRAAFIHFDTRPIDDDVPVKPGETHTFSVSEMWRQGWSDFKHRRNAVDPGKATIEFVHLSFGDGSGFDGGGVPYPYKRDKSSGPCRERPKEVAAATSAIKQRAPSWAISRESLRSIPAVILPVSFFITQPSYVGVKLESCV